MADALKTNTAKTQGQSGSHAESDRDENSVMLNQITSMLKVARKKEVGDKSEDDRTDDSIMMPNGGEFCVQGNSKYLAMILPRLQNSPAGKGWSNTKVITNQGRCPEKGYPDALMNTCFRQSLLFFDDANETRRKESKEFDMKYIREYNEMGHTWEEIKEEQGKVCIPPSAAMIANGGTVCVQGGPFYLGRAFDRLRESPLSPGWDDGKFVPDGTCEEKGFTMGPLYNSCFPEAKTWLNETTAHKLAGFDEENIAKWRADPENSDFTDEEIDEFMKLVCY